MSHEMPRGRHQDILKASALWGLSTGSRATAASMIVGGGLVSEAAGAGTRRPARPVQNSSSKETSPLTPTW